MDAKPPKSEPKYWFPAKRYGWGWAFPHCWQGWVVFVCYFVGIAAAGMLLNATNHLGLFLFVVGVLTSCLIAICFLKGEPPRWRWGDK